MFHVPCSDLRHKSARRKPDEALTWVDRRLALEKKQAYGSTAQGELTKLKRQLLTKLGRGGDALEDAWTEFREHPNKYTYEELMRFVPKAERAISPRSSLAHVCLRPSRTLPFVLFVSIVQNV